MNKEEAVALFQGQFTDFLRSYEDLLKNADLSDDEKWRVIERVDDLIQQTAALRGPSHLHG